MTRKNKKNERRERAKVRTQQRKEQRKGKGRNYLKTPDGTEFLTLKTRMRLDVIPFVIGDDPDDLYYTKDFKVHRNIGPENTTILCPKSVGKPCPICEEVVRLSKDWTKNKDEVIAIGAKDRNLYNVIDLDDEDKGIQLWDISYKLFEEYLQSELDEYGEDDDERFFWELEDGKTLKIRFSKETLGDGHYFETKRIDFEDQEEKYEKSILEECLDLNDIFVVFDYDTVEALFLGIPKSSDDGEEPADDEPIRERKRKRKTTSPRKRKKEESEEEESEEEESEEEESEEEESEEEESEDKPKPERKSKKRRKKEKDEPERKSKKRRKKEEKADDDEFPPEDDEGGESDSDCPHGYDFGNDLNQYDECDTCDSWDACYDYKDEIKKKKKKKKK